MELLFVYIYCLLSLFTLIRGHIWRLEMPIEVGELREIDQESTFCASFSLPYYPIYVTKIEPFVKTNRSVFPNLRQLTVKKS